MRPRAFLRSALAAGLLYAVVGLAGPAFAEVTAEQQPIPVPAKRIAAVVSAYYPNSHADVLVSRLVQTDTLDFKGRVRPLKLVSLYTDQVPANDMGRKIAAAHHVALCDNVADTLTLGTGKLAVDGVLLIAEHGKYPLSPSGQMEYPKRRFFEEVVKVFESSGRVVPVFIDKHLADNWEDAKWIYDTASRLKIPLMAGSSLRVTWRRPPVDMPPGARLDEILALSYGPLEAYGFHALEVIDVLAARREGGACGIRRVQALSGDAVWEAGKNGVYSADLLKEAVKRVDRPAIHAPKPLEELVPKPALFIVDYEDGLRARILHVGGLYAGWTAAWRYRDEPRVDSTLFWTQEARPIMHFSYLLDGIESMMLSGKPAWPVEGTLLSTGALTALMTSQARGGRKIETPHLRLKYSTTWSWQSPPPPPPDRPFNVQ